MRRKTQQELKNQGLGTKNEKNLNSGQLPAYFEMKRCSLPDHGTINFTQSRKQALDEPMRARIERK